MARATLFLAGAVATLAIATVGLVACGGGKDSGVAASKLPDGVRDEKLDHEGCNENGMHVETLDANNDSKADVRLVSDPKTNKKVCLVTDLNHDGRPDMYEYYDANGNVRRREADFDATGTIDSIELYSGGKLTEKELDTTGQNRIDTWDFYGANGKVIRRERDTTNDGRIDQWWTFDDTHIVIAYDKDNDGHPDPSSTLTLNLDGTLADDPTDASATSAPAAAASGSNGDGGAASSFSTTPTLYDAGVAAEAPVDAGSKKRAASSGKTKKK